MLHAPRFTLLALCSVLFLLAPLAFGQFSPDPQEFNTREDIINSLIPGKPHLRKEKKEEVDPKTLPSHSVKDPTFSGSLMDVGLSSASAIKAPKEKPSADASDKKSTTAAESTSQQSSKAASANNATGQPADDAAKAKPAKPDQKPSPTPQSDAKPDGNH